MADCKRAHDRARQLEDEAAAARDFAALDDLEAVRLECTRRGGALLLGGAERLPGIDDELWVKRAQMDETVFARAVQKAQSMKRYKAGAPVARRTSSAAEPQARTLLSEWMKDGFSNPTRYLVGVCKQRFDREVTAGRDPQEVAAALIREAVG